MFYVVVGRWVLKFIESDAVRGSGSSREIFRENFVEKNAEVENSHFSRNFRQFGFIIDLIICIRTR